MRPVKPEQSAGTIGVKKKGQQKGKRVSGKAHGGRDNWEGEKKTFFSRKWGRRRTDGKRSVRCNGGEEPRGGGGKKRQSRGESGEGVLRRGRGTLLPRTKRWANGAGGKPKKERGGNI